MTDLLTFRTYMVAGSVTPKGNDNARQLTGYKFKLKQPADADNDDLYLQAASGPNHTILDSDDQGKLATAIGTRGTVSMDANGHIETENAGPPRISKSDYKNLELTVSSVPGTTTNGIELQFGSKSDGYTAILTPKQRTDFYDTLRAYRASQSRPTPTEITVVRADGTTEPSLNIPSQP